MRFLNKKEFKIFLTFFVIYAVFTQFYGWTSASRLDTTLAMVYDHSFVIDKWKDLPPFSTADFSFYDGHYYSSKAPLDSFLAVPTVYIFKLVFGYPEWFPLRWLLAYIVTLLNSALFSALTCVLLYKLLKCFTKNEKHVMLVIFAYGLGTIAFFLATFFVGHSSSNFFVLLAFYMLFKMKTCQKSSRYYPFLIGVSLGLAFAGEYTYFFVILLLIIYSILNLRSLKYVLYIFSGIFLIISLLMIYHYIIFDNPFVTGYSFLDKTIYKSAPLVNLDITALVKYLNYIFGIPFSHHDISTKTRLLTSNILQVLFFPLKGLFFFSPILLFSLIGLFYMRKEYKQETLLITITFFFYVLWVSSRWLWFTGDGPTIRRLAPVIPFLMIPLCYSFKRLNRKVLYTLLFISILIGFVTLQRIDYFLNYKLYDCEIRYNFLCLYHQIEIPLSNYYLPLFVKFGPTSYLIEKGLNIRLPPFLNILVASMLVSLLWLKSIRSWMMGRKRLILATALLILILTGARVLFVTSVSSYTQKLYEYHLTEKRECHPFVPVYAEITSRLNNTSLNTRLIALNNVTSLADYSFFNIPYILEIDPEIRPDKMENENWYKPVWTFLIQNHTSMSQDATIHILNRDTTPQKVVFEFEVVSLLNDALLLYLNDAVVAGYHIKEGYDYEKRRLTTSNFESYNIELNLKPGDNVLMLHSVRGCSLSYMLSRTSKDIACRSFVFNKVLIKKIT